jgi:hypothetical protein
MGPATKLDTIRCSYSMFDGRQRSIGQIDACLMLVYWTYVQHLRP